MHNLFDIKGMLEEMQKRDLKNLNAIPFHNICKTREVINLFALSTFQSPRNGDDLSDGEPLETEERSHTPPPRMDSPEDNLTPQLKVKVNKRYSKQPFQIQKTVAISNKFDHNTT